MLLLQKDDDDDDDDDDVVVIVLKLWLTEEHGQGEPAVSIKDQPHSFVFASKNWSTTEDRLLLLIHGSGVVRAGQWARRYSTRVVP